MTFGGFSRPFGTCGTANVNPAVNCRAILNSPSGREPPVPASWRRRNAAGSVKMRAPQAAAAGGDALQYWLNSNCYAMPIRRVATALGQRRRNAVVGRVAPRAPSHTLDKDWLSMKVGRLGARGATRPTIYELASSPRYLRVGIG